MCRDGRAKLALSFSSSGLLVSYHLGVADRIAQQTGGLLQKVDTFLGASGGALVAALLCCAPEKVWAVIVNRCMPIIN
jgi:predicted acylesterase/phospholipase RssA